MASGLEPPLRSLGGAGKLLCEVGLAGDLTPGQKDPRAAGRCHRLAVGVGDFRTGYGERAPPMNQAGARAEVEFTYRNTERVTFRAYAFDMQSFIMDGMTAK